MVRLVLSHQRGTGVLQQLCQSSHLRRQVPRVPERRQTSGVVVRLVLPHQRGTGVLQQLCQPSHLRRQVPRVPERHQTSGVETESTESLASFCYHLTRFRRRVEGRVAPPHRIPIRHADIF